jgi:hypothetical protein
MVSGRAAGGGLTPATVGRPRAGVAAPRPRAPAPSRAARGRPRLTPCQAPPPPAMASDKKDGPSDAWLVLHYKVRGGGAAGRGRARARGAPAAGPVPAGARARARARAARALAAARAPRPAHAAPAPPRPRPPGGPLPARRHARLGALPLCAPQGQGAPPRPAALRLRTRAVPRHDAGVQRLGSALAAARQRAAAALRPLCALARGRKPSLHSPAPLTPPRRRSRAPAPAATSAP